MASVTYARARLTNTQDRRYRAYIEQFLLPRKNQRPMRPPRQRDIFGTQAEHVVRQRLAEQWELSHNRILEYEERRGRRGLVKYRELDVVILEDKRTVWVSEVKASRKTATLHRAISQLQETRAILRVLYPVVNATLFFVDTGTPTAEEIAELMAGPDAPSAPPRTLDEAISLREEVLRPITTMDERTRDGSRIDLVCYSVDDIVAMAGDEPLALDWSDDDEPDEFPPPAREPTRVYSTSDSSDDDSDDSDESDNDSDDSDDDEGGALAEALRRAGFGS